MARTPTPFVPADVLRQVVLEEHDLAADGSFAVVARRSVSGNRYRAHLWLVPLRRGAASDPGGVHADRPVRLTRGAVRDRSPRIAPDGRSVAFRRRPADASTPYQVSLLRLGADGTPRGKVRTLTRGDHEVRQLAWSPDCARLAFTRQGDPVRFIVGTEPDDDEPLARHIRRTDWRYDGEGIRDRWEQLFVIGTQAGARARQLTRWGSDAYDISWTPDGTAIVFTADPRADADLRPRTSIWRVAARGGEPVEVLSLGANARAAAVSPDGRWIAAVGVVDAEALDDVSPGLVLGPSDGAVPAHALAPDLDRPIGVWVDTDQHGWIADSTTAPVWLDDASLVALVSDAGRCVPYHFRIDPTDGAPAGPPERLVEGDVAAHVMAAQRGVVTLLATSGPGAMELHGLLLDEAPPGLRRLTTLGSRWQRDRLLPEMRVLRAPGPGGVIETWIASPPDAGDAALPAIVDVHGGPLGAWAPTPSIEVLLLVGRGYRVILPNIRGSATYGAGWIRPQLGDWGGVDAADVHAVLDHCIEIGLIDRGRLGVLGLSYGGFMVHWLVGTSDRFKAAVSENGVVNQVSAWANSDTGPEYSRTSRLGDTFSADQVEKLWRQSPLRHVSDMHTPLLMLQAGADLRCPPADNEQLFIALRHLGREVEYVLYPDEYHVYQADGRPDRRVDRHTRMLDWFDRHLSG